jgi:hypothetical protein
MTGIDVIIAVTITAMIDTTITIAMTITIGVTTEGMITATTSAMTDETIDVAKMIIITTTIITKNGLYHHRIKGPTPMVRSSQPPERSASSSAVAK